MSLNDIWLKVNKEVGFYTKETFANISALPGVYAWFYPLRIFTKDFDEFVNDVAKIQNYDSLKCGKPQDTHLFEFAWKRVEVGIELGYPMKRFQSFKRDWDLAVENEETFEQLRSVVMKSSIMMPPLYVGKTDNLKIRCAQHVNGNDKRNNFHSRYTNYAVENKVFARRVSDLLFVCIKTKEEEDAQTSNLNDFEGLVEEILKYLAKPVYSVK